MRDGNGLGRVSTCRKEDAWKEEEAGEEVDCEKEWDGDADADAKEEERDEEEEE